MDIEDLMRSRDFRLGLAYAAHLLHDLTGGIPEVVTRPCCRSHSRTALLAAAMTLEEEAGVKFEGHCNIRRSG